MCGIVGIVGDDAHDRGLLRAMMDRVAHRGPDGTGTYLDAGCALGHQRLAVIDLAGGPQPILSADGTRAIVYNGEIYNHGAVRRALERNGVTFRTQSDSEVPLHLLADEKDPLVLNRLEGMFAFAIWDGTTRRLAAARDPFGIKPFYWTQVGGTFLFASEMKALLAHPNVPATISDHAVREKAVFEYLLPGTTWLKGIHALPPGHLLVTDGRTVNVRPWFRPARAHPPRAPEAQARTLLGLLSDAVRSELMSEVPLGVILSGGLDSSLIAAINRRMDPDRRIATFSAAEDETNADAVAARRVAESLGTDHHESFFTRDDLERDLAPMLWSIEDVDYETYFFYPLFRSMRRDATVGLCGQGADEVFGGYARYRDLAATRERIRARTAAAFPHEPTRHNSLAEDHYRDLASALAFERGAQLSDFQLRLVDRNSMAFGAEMRVPFLDTRVIAFGAALPPSDLLDATTEKVALRRAARLVDLPPDIVARPKVPAGRSTAQRIIGAFEADVARAYPAARLARHPYRAALRKPAEFLALDLFCEIYEHRRGTPPHNLHWRDLVG